MQEQITNIKKDLIRYHIEQENKLNELLLDAENKEVINKINELKDAIEKALRSYLVLK